MNTLHKNRTLTYVALLSAMAIALNLLETAMIPPLFGVFRVGLANIIALIAWKILGVKEMIIVNLMRVLIGSLLSGTFLGSTFWISLGGVCLSTLALLLGNLLKSSVMFTSVMSAVAHSTGQVLVVMNFYKQAMMISTLPYFIALSVPVGLFTGYIATVAIRRVRPLK
ncbi:MAG: Gx transporter family protein [Bulleidia sp.]